MFSWCCEETISICKFSVTKINFSFSSSISCLHLSCFDIRVLSRVIGVWMWEWVRAIFLIVMLSLNSASIPKHTYRDMHGIGRWDTQNIPLTVHTAYLLWSAIHCGNFYRIHVQIQFGNLSVCFAISKQSIDQTIDRIFAMASDNNEVKYIQCPMKRFRFRSNDKQKSCVCLSLFYLNLYSGSSWQDGPSEKRIKLDTNPNNNAPVCELNHLFPKIGNLYLVRFSSVFQ